MKKIFTFLCATLFFTGCIYMLYGATVQPNPKELWNYITKKNPYKNWSYWPDHKGMQRGNAPHGPWHKVFVNKKALNSKEPPVNYGSIIVKENFSKNKKLKVITVMYKVKGFKSSAGDWFWVKYAPNGKVLAAGKPNPCIGCHSARYKNDYIILYEFK